jgi:Domain of unknown function (DUF4338)
MGAVCAEVTWDEATKTPVTTDETISAEPSGTVTVQVAAAAEIAWFDAQLTERQYLGAGRSVGNYLKPAVTVPGQVAALLAWGPACYALKDRDRWMGWSAHQRVERLELIVQNRRFLVLGEKGRSPNLIHTNTLAENLADVQDKDRFHMIVAHPPFSGKERKEVPQNFPIRTARPRSSSSSISSKSSSPEAAPASSSRTPSSPTPTTPPSAWARNFLKNAISTPCSTAPRARSAARV